MPDSLPAPNALAVAQAPVGSKTLWGSAASTPGSGRVGVAGAVAAALWQGFVPPSKHCPMAVTSAPAAAATTVLCSSAAPVPAAAAPGAAVLTGSLAAT